MQHLDDDYEAREADARAMEDEDDEVLEFEDFEDFDEEVPVECSMCGGPAGILGQLGNLIHYTCRDCGMMFSAEA